MNFFDSHCHLQDERIAGSLDVLMERARAAGVAACVCCGSAESDWGAVAALKPRFAGLIPCFGLHPWYVRQRTPAWLPALRERLLADPGAAVGEIGLDGMLGDGSESEQDEVFRAQLALAKELGRAASIHCRRAWEPLLRILKEVGPFPAGFAIHSYSGSVELLEPLLSLGGHVSFSGSITSPNNVRGRKAAAAAPLERILIETDAPDLAPHMPDRPGATRDAPNEPAHLVYVARELAGLRQMTVAETAAKTWENGRRLFQPREAG